MHVTDPYGHGYHYGAEQIKTLDPMNGETLANCYQAIGLPVAAREQGQYELTFTAPGPAEAEALRRHLRMHGIRHTSTLTVSHEPHATTPSELIELFAYARCSRALDEALREEARALLCTPPQSLYEGPHAAIETLYRRLGATGARARIHDAERRANNATS
jgi:hypothetical protein